jgi:hypothetical protein
MIQGTATPTPTPPPHLPNKRLARALQQEKQSQHQQQPPHQQLRTEVSLPSLGTSTTLLASRLATTMPLATSRTSTGPLMPCSV